MAAVKSVSMTGGGRDLIIAVDLTVKATFKTPNYKARVASTLFRAFEIAPSFQERFGYPALTPEVKRRILGRNAIDLFGIAPPATTCTTEPLGLRGTNRTFGPVSRRDVARTFIAEHP